MSPDELQRVFATFMALQKKLGHEGPALRDAALQFGRGLSQTLTVFHKHLASQFPPGTDLSQVRLGWVIPPPGERTAAPPDPYRMPGAAPLARSRRASFFPRDSRGSASMVMSFLIKSF